MSKDSSLRNSIVTFYFIFAKKNFPEGCIVFGIGGDEHFVPKSAIVDPKSGLILAFLEIHSEPDESLKKALSENYAALKIRKNLNVPIFLFQSSLENSHEPRIFILSTGNTWEAISKESFPDFETLSSFQKIEHDETPRKEAVSSAKTLTNLTHTFAVFLLALFTLDLFKVISITQIHLWLLLGAAILAVLPYFSIIKIWKFFELKNASETKE